MLTLYNLYISFTNSSHEWSIATSFVLDIFRNRWLATCCAFRDASNPDLKLRIAVVSNGSKHMILNALVSAISPSLWFMISMYGVIYCNFWRWCTSGTWRPKRWFACKIIPPYHPPTSRCLMKIVFGHLWATNPGPKKQMNPKAAKVPDSTWLHHERPAQLWHLPGHEPLVPARMDVSREKNAETQLGVKQTTANK